MVNGRDHNHWGFSMWLAGGGTRGGHVHGATDEFGFKTIENRVHVHDLHAKLLHLMGFDHEKFTYRSVGRDFRLTDVSRHLTRQFPFENGFHFSASRNASWIWFCSLRFNPNRFAMVRH